MIHFSKILSILLMTVATFTFGSCNATVSGCSPQVPAIHSHNDYAQAEPFYGAYRARAASIEADVYLVNNQICVGHDAPTDVTLYQAYLRPIRKEMSNTDGSAYPDGSGLQLLVDLKDGPETLDALVRVINAQFIANFDVNSFPTAVRLVITGDKIPPAEFDKYPDYVFFDARPDVTLTPAQLGRVAMISDYFGKYSKWKGNGPIPERDERKLRAVIDEAHKRGKKVRFWAFPDNPTAWKTAVSLGIDFINTDHPADVVEYFQLLGK